MFLKKNRVYDLNHRAYFLRGQKKTTILAASQQGLITLIDTETGNLNQISLPANIREISISNLNKTIALIDNATGNLVVVDFEGQVLFWDKPPRATIFPDDPQFSGFQSCYFDEDENRLWCAARLSAADEVELQLRRVDDWSIVDKVAVEDPFSLSYYSFSPTSDRNIAALSIAAGQDGADVWWLTNDNDTIKYREDPKLEESIQPIFSPDGSEFLIQYNHESFRQYQYPSMEKTGEYYLELDEDDVGYCICYLNENLALINSQNGLIFLVDTKQKKIVEDVIIENRPPMPVSHYYPSLKDDDGLYTDLGFEGFGDNVVFVYRRSPNEDSIIIIPKSKLLDEISI